MILHSIQLADAKSVEIKYADYPKEPGTKFTAVEVWVDGKSVVSIFIPLGYRMPNP